MAKLEFVFKHNEIQKMIPYELICTTRESSVWDTMKRKRRWKAEFTEEERAKAEKIFRNARSWYLGRGVPEEVRISYADFELWNKIASFCCSL